MKHLRHWALLLLGAVWLSGWMVMEVPGFNMEAFFFFSVGAYFSVNKKDPTELLRPCFPAALVLWLLLAASVGFVLQQPAEGYLTRLSVLAGVVAVSSMAVRFVEKGRWRANGRPGRTPPATGGSVQALGRRDKHPAKEKRESPPPQQSGGGGLRAIA